MIKRIWPTHLKKCPLHLYHEFFIVVLGVWEMVVKNETQILRKRLPTRINQIKVIFHMNKILMGNKQPINRLAQKASVNGDQKNTCLLTSNGQRKDFTCLVHLKHNSQYLIYSKVFSFLAK